jgi:hypothetical protein
LSLFFFGKAGGSNAVDALCMSDEDDGPGDAGSVAPEPARADSGIAANTEPFSPEQSVSFRLIRHFLLLTEHEIGENLLTSLNVFFSRNTA